MVFTLRVAVDGAGADPAALTKLNDAISAITSAAENNSEAIKFVQLANQPDTILTLRGSDLWFLTPGEVIPPPDSKDVRVFPFVIDQSFTAN